ncbi:hypothetical protein F4805DRAFT_474175 [Annulohypoxylon moriforme]|nr:hypothetical protein F4805DRAFT_474175 [Annulohypoxylon moriforme]
MEKSRPSPISTLSNELLLSIFESGLPSSTLLQCMLCCKRWSPLSFSVLYKHLVLTLGTLSTFVRCPTRSGDALIETLTLRINLVRSAETEDAIRRLESDLCELATRVGGMGNLRVFSLFAPSKLPSNRWVASRSIAAVLGSLPRNCANLELDIRYLCRPGIVDEEENVHLCTSIRGVIPRLRSLRLSLSKLCPEAFGFGFDPRGQLGPARRFEPVKAPRLERCIVKIAETKYFSGLDRSWVCGFPDSDIVSVLATHLLIFKDASNAPELKRLWMIDASPITDLYATLHAFVRRDVLAEKSWLLPYKNVGLHKFDREGIFIRMPNEEGGQDLVSTIDGVAGLVEQHAWVETIERTRIPAAEIPRARELVLAKPTVRTAGEWLAETNISCVLWVDEKNTGSRLLDVVEEGLVGDSTAVVRTPDGWARSAGGFLQRLGYATQKAAGIGVLEIIPSHPWILIMRYDIAYAEHGRPCELRQVFPLRQSYYACYAYSKRILGTRGLPFEVANPQTAQFSDLRDIASENRNGIRIPRSSVSVCFDKDEADGTKMDVKAALEKFEDDRRLSSLSSYF